MPTSQPIRILIAGHDHNFRTRLCHLVENIGHAQIIGQVSTDVNAVSIILSMRPDIVLMDMAVGGSNGLAVTRQLKSQRPTIPVVLFTCLDEREYLGVARYSGVDRCLNKQRIEKELIPLLKSMTESSH